MPIKYILILAIASIAIGCLETSQKSEDDQVVASVYNANLYQSELEDIILTATGSADSSVLAQAYIDQWIRDQLLIKEAGKYFSNDDEVNKLVEDYKGSLIKFYYETKIVEERFDTVVSPAELHNFYEKSKEKFILSQSVYRAQLARIAKDHPKKRELYRQWNKNELTDIWIAADSSRIDTSGWLVWTDITDWSPEFSQKKANKPSDQRIITEESEIFLKILERRAEKEISPLPFVSVQLKQMILLKRRIELLEKQKDELYNKALEANQIKIGLQ